MKKQADIKDKKDKYYVAKTSGKFGLHFSFLCAINGIIATFKSQRNFKIQSIFAIVAIVLSVVLKLEPSEFLLILIFIALVLSLECVNSAIEACIDLQCKEYSELAKIAKDACAGGVLVSSLCALIAAIVLFLPKILNL